MLLNQQTCLDCFDVQIKKVKKGWNDIIFDLLIDATGRKCVWQFKRHTFFEVNSSLFTFDAYCADCGSKLVGKSAEEIDSEGLKVILSVMFSANPYKKFSRKRKLSGPTRDDIGTKMIKEKKTAFALRCQMANKSMSFGDEEGPTLYSESVSFFFF